MRFKNAIAVLALACTILGLAVPANAQEPAPKADWFLGYSFLKPDAIGRNNPRLGAGRAAPVSEPAFGDGAATRRG